jgi:hypothetical protein
MVKKLFPEAVCGIYLLGGRGSGKRDALQESRRLFFYIGESADVHHRLNTHRRNLIGLGWRTFLLHEWPSGADKKTRLHKENRFVRAAIQMGLSMRNDNSLHVGRPVAGDFTEEAAILNEVLALLRGARK